MIPTIPGCVWDVLSPHEGVALQVARHMPGWPLHYSLWCSSIYLMMLTSSAYSTFFLHVSVIFLEPFPIYRGIWVVFVSHILRYYCISPCCYPRHSTYVGFIIIFLPSSCLCEHVLYFSVPCLLDALLFVLCLSGHRYASPASCRMRTHS